jgi:branched-chain amino acid transport system substrate-binding protein
MGITRKILTFGILVGAGLGGWLSHAQPSTQRSAALRLGFVLDFTGALSEHGNAARSSAELAVRQLNAGGGVFGQPVEAYFADGGTDGAMAVAAARRLIEVDGVHAIVGPMGSAATLAMAREVTIPARIPSISPSATAPSISELDDDDLVFRATASDAAQGPVLAKLLRDDRFATAAVLYRDDAYGKGLYDTFVAHFGGQVRGVGVRGDQESYLPELRQVAGPQVLLALTYPEETQVLVGEALRSQLFQRFVFADATRMADLMDRIDPVALEGAKGTSPAPRDGVDQPSTRAFLEAHRAAFGDAPRFGPGASVFDATICLGLAAERGKSTSANAIRDNLRPVCSGPGETFIASGASIAGALAAIRAGRDVDYEGAGSSVDWNRHGDVATGFVDIWAYSKGAIASLELVPFDLRDVKPGP